MVGDDVDIQDIRLNKCAFNTSVIPIPPALALFPVTPQELKTPGGEEAINPDNLVCRTVRSIKEAHDDIGVICDVALDPYTTHGQDGIVRDGEIINDETLDVVVGDVNLDGAPDGLEFADGTDPLPVSHTVTAADGTFTSEPSAKSVMATFCGGCVRAVTIA